MHIADLCGDMNILQTAQNAAKELLASDPALAAPENAALLSRVRQLFEANRGTIN